MLLHKNKSLWFQHWIDSGIVYINDLLDNTGSINIGAIKSKLSIQRNWIAEYHAVMAALPVTWKTAIMCHESRVTLVTINKQLTRMDRGVRTFTAEFDFKKLYIVLVSRKFERAYVERAWCRIFNNQPERCLWNNIWSFTTDMYENKLKQFRYRLLHRILPCGMLAHRWRLIDSPLCPVCNVIEDYEHLFITCQNVRTTWVKIKYFLETLGFKNIRLSLDTLIMGYKLKQKAYHFVNHFMIVIMFGIYKEYCSSNNRTKHTETFQIVKKECLMRAKLDITQYGNLLTNFELFCKNNNH